MLHASLPSDQGPHSASQRQSNHTSETYLSCKYWALFSAQPSFKCLANPTRCVEWPGTAYPTNHRSWLALSKSSFSEPGGTPHILRNGTTGVLSVVFFDSPLMGWTIGWRPHKEINLLCNKLKRCQMKKGPFVGHVQNLSRIYVAVGCTLWDLDITETKPPGCWHRIMKYYNRIKVHLYAILKVIQTWVCWT